MIDRLISGICKAISDKFGAEYEIYKGSTEQGAEPPCFCVSFVSSDTSNLVGNERKEHTLFISIAFIPEHSNRETEEINRVALWIPQVIARIVHDGVYFVGSGIKSEVSDGMLVTTATYAIESMHIDNSPYVEDISLRNTR